MVALLKMPQSLAAEEQVDERRMFPRRQVHARIQGRRIDHTLSARRDPFLSLYTHDLSVGGLSASSDRPLELGEHVTVFFPPQGSSRGWDAYGRVLRCSPSAMGWRVALEFDPLPAA
jgi:hypothetical protein